MDSETMVARLTALEDVHAIGNLKSHYCYLLDVHRTEDAAALFTEDGVFDGGETFGRHEGRAAVAAYFDNIQSNGLCFALHGVLSPFIEVRTPTTAFGRWYLDMPSTFRSADGTERAVWGAGWYEDDFAKGADGVWRISRVRITNHFWTPFEEGWAKQPFLAP